MISFLTVGACVPCVRAQKSLRSATSPPPAAPVREVTDDYFGTKVTDPYRWMEDMKNPELLAWMKAQADYTRGVLDALPGRAEALRRLNSLGDSATARVSEVRRFPANRYFYLKRLAKENISKLYTRDGLGGGESILIDPEKMSDGATQHLAISYYEPSWDGKLVAVTRDERVSSRQRQDRVPGGNVDARHQRPAR
jgi:prolyl oligopeptidase